MKMSAQQKVLALYAGGAIIAYFAVKTFAPKIAGDIATLPAQVVGGAVDALDDPARNPLHGFGTWLGGVIYDATHPAQ